MLNPKLGNLRGRVRAFRDEAIADLAIERGLINEAQLAKCFDDVEANGGTLPEAMVRRGHVSPEQLRELKSARRGAELGEMVAQYAGETPAEISSTSERFGKFILTAEIGHGGMGVVHRAWQTDLGRWVAIKRLRLEGSGSTARFLREARLAARIVHPNMVPIHEVGEIENTPYLAMALIDGGSLEGRKLPPRRALEVILLVARATQELHLAGILHRDIKPGNILVDRADRVYLGDFSLARQDDTPGLSKSGLMVGTPAYAPPEQLRGETAKIGPHSDVYSLGATLYSLLTGEFPFDGPDAMAVAYRALESEPPLLREREPDINRQIQTIVQKAMRKRPDERYGSAEEFANDVKRYLDGQTLMAKPPGAWEHLRDRAIRHRVALGVALFVLVVGAVLPFVLRRQQREIIAHEVKIAHDRLERFNAARESLDAFLGCPATSTAYPELERKTASRIAAAMKDDPRSVPARLLNARFLNRCEGPTRTLAELDEIARLEPENPALLAMRARITLVRYLMASQRMILDQGRTTVGDETRFDKKFEALHAVAALRKSKGQEEEILLIEGFIACADRRWSEAAAMIGKYIESQPMDREARLVRANALVFGKALDEAMSEADFLVKNFGEQLHRVLRANIQIQRDDCAGALVTLRDVDPRRTDHWVMTAAAQYGLGKYAEAIDATDRAITMEPGNGYWWWNKAFYCRAARRYDESLQAINKASELGLPEERILMERTMLFHALGRQEELRTDLEALLSLQTGQARTYTAIELMKTLYRIAAAATAQDVIVGAHRRCIELSNRILGEEGPKCAEAFYFRAASHQMLHQMDVQRVERHPAPILEDIERCLALQPAEEIAYRARVLRDIVNGK